MKDAFKETNGVKKIESKAKRLSKFLRRSNLAKNYMIAACEKTGHKFTRMKSCIDIRWNSEYDCFECIELMDRKRQLDEVSHAIPTRQEWRVLEGIIKILKPVKIVTKVFESQTNPTINRVAEEIFNLEEQLKEMINDEEEHSNVKAFAKNLRRSIQRRFPDYALGEKIVGFGNFLDPRLKGIRKAHLRRSCIFIFKRAVVQHSWSL